MTDIRNKTQYGTFEYYFDLLIKKLKINFWDQNDPFVKWARAQQQQQQQKKQNKLNDVRPAKNQISVGIRTV